MTRNSPLSGEVALWTLPAAVFNEENITAITSVTADNHTVLITGTTGGRIVKVRVSIFEIYRMSQKVRHFTDC